MPQFHLPAAGASSDDVLIALETVHDCMQELLAAAARQAVKDQAATHALITRHRQAAGRRAMALDNRLKQAEAVLATITDPREGLGARIDTLLAGQARTLRAVGADKPGDQHSVLAMSQLGLIWRMLASLGAVTLLWKIANAAWPSVWSMILAINSALLR